MQAQDSSQLLQPESPGSQQPQAQPAGNHMLHQHPLNDRRPVAEAIENLHLPISTDAWMAASLPALPNQADGAFIGHMLGSSRPSISDISRADPWERHETLQLCNLDVARRPVAEAQEGSIQSPLEVEVLTEGASPGMASPAESTQPLTSAGPMHSPPAASPSHSRVAQNGPDDTALESRPSSASVPQQPHRQSPSGERGPWWRHGFLKSGPPSGDTPPPPPPPPLPPGQAPHTYTHRSTFPQEAI